MAGGAWQSFVLPDARLSAVAEGNSDPSEGGVNEEEEEDDVVFIMGPEGQ